MENRRPGGRFGRFLPVVIAKRLDTLVKYDIFYMVNHPKVHMLHRLTLQVIRDFLYLEGNKSSFRAEQGSIDISTSSLDFQNQYVLLLIILLLVSHSLTLRPWIMDLALLTIFLVINHFCRKLFIQNLFPLLLNQWVQNKSKRSCTSYPLSSVNLNSILYALGCPLV